MIHSIPAEERLKSIVAAIQSSVLVEVSSDSTKIRRNPEMPLPEGNSESKTIYLKGFNKVDTNLERLIGMFLNHLPSKTVRAVRSIMTQFIIKILHCILEHFSKYEGMERVIMRYYKEKLLAPSHIIAKLNAETKEGDSKDPDGEVPKPVEEAPKATTTVPSSITSKIIWVKKFKGSILVVFKTEDQAKKALADITTYAGNPVSFQHYRIFNPLLPSDDFYFPFPPKLMKLMQPEYLAMKKKEFMERAELRNARKRKSDGGDGTSTKKAKAEKVDGGDSDVEEEEEKEDESLKGVLVKLLDIPDGTTREVIKEHWYKATSDKEKFGVRWTEVVILVLKEFFIHGFQIFRWVLLISNAVTRREFYVYQTKVLLPRPWLWSH